MSVTPTGQEAFLRLETPDDFFDLVYLHCSGVNVGYEPVTGTISGFSKPMSLIVTRGPKGPPANILHPNLYVELILKDTPEDLASAVRFLLCDKARHKRLSLDMTHIDDGPRGQTIQIAITALYTMLSHRASRYLSVTDIVDVVSALSIVGTGRLDAQVRYGSKSWNEFTRGVSDQKLPPVPISPGPNQSRTLVCVIPPMAHHMKLILENSVGLANYLVCEDRAYNFRGLNPSKSLLLGNHVLCNTGKIDLGGIASDEGRLKATRDAGGELFKMIFPVASCLQSVWNVQRQCLKPYALSVIGAPMDELKALGIEAELGGRDASKELDLQWPRSSAHQNMRFEGSAIEQLEAQQRWLPYSDNCGTVIRMAEDEIDAVSDWLKENWDRFVAAGFDRHLAS